MMRPRHVTDESHGVDEPLVEAVGEGAHRGGLGVEDLAGQGEISHAIFTAASTATS